MRCVLCGVTDGHGDDSPQPEDDEQAPEFRFEFRDGETMEKAAQRVHREAWYAGYRRKAEINRLAGIKNTSQAQDDAAEPHYPPTGWVDLGTRMIAKLEAIRKLCDEADAGDRLDPDGALHTFRREILKALNG